MDESKGGGWSQRFARSDDQPFAFNSELFWDDLKNIFWNSDQIKVGV